MKRFASSSHQKDICTFIMVLSVSCRLFRTTSGMVKQMEEDKLRFGAAAWACAAPRLEKLRFVLAKETLQHMRTTEMCLNRKQDNIKEKVPVILHKLIPQSDSCLCRYSSPFLSWQFRHWCECKVAIETFSYFFTIVTSVAFAPVVCWDVTRCLRAVLSFTWYSSLIGICLCRAPLIYL